MTPKIFETLVQPYHTLFYIFYTISRHWRFCWGTHGGQTILRYLHPWTQRRNARFKAVFFHHKEAVLKRIRRTTNRRYPTPHFSRLYIPSSIQGFVSGALFFSRIPAGMGNRQTRRGKAGRQAREGKGRNLGGREKKMERQDGEDKTTRSL